MRFTFFALLLLLQTNLSLGLSKDQRQAIDLVNSHGFYSVDVVEIPIESKVKTIVLLGELHHFPSFKIPKEVTALINQFPVRLIENSGSLREIEHTVMKFDRNGAQFNALKKMRRQEDVAANNEHFEYNSIIGHAMDRGFFVSSQNELIYNGKLFGVLNSDGIYWNQESVQEIINTIPPRQFFSLISRFKGQVTNARRKISKDFIGDYEASLRFGKGTLLYSEFFSEITLGAEFGSGMKFLDLPNGRGLSTNNKHDRPPTLRDYLMAENLLAALSSLETNVILFLAASVHNQKIVKVIQAPSFSEWLEKKVK